MPTIVVKEDNLNELNKNYVQSRLLTPIFLNSVPKCGTHLVRNVMRMFVPVEQQYHAAFIQHAVLRQHQVAFSQIAPHLSWGHLLFSDDAAVLLRHTHKIVQIRDPYDWVLARARFFLSDSFQGSLEHLKGGNATIDEVINMMIFGIHGKAPSLNDIFTHNAVAWMNSNVRMLKFEDLLENVRNLDSDEAELFFSGLMRDCGLDGLPDDWRERVRVGSDRNQSSTARENLAGGGDLVVPKELSEHHKALVNYAAPGLRTMLGYE